MERVTFKTLFYVKNTGGKNGEVPVILHVTMNGIRVETSVNLKVNPKKWNAVAGRSMGDTRKDDEVNARLDTICMRVMQTYRQMELDGEQITAQDIINAFMESYMRQKETELLDQYEKQVSEFESVVLLSKKEWNGFEIGELFEVSAGKSKGLNHLQSVANGGVNYLRATNQNNGVLAYVNKVEQMTHKGNSICFIRKGEGSMGFSIYKAEDFIATSDISVGYADFLNKYIGLFITTVADKVRGKYNFGHKRNETRLKKEKILLPVNSKNEPDYVYMENFMKSLESKKVRQYLEYVNNR